MMMSGEPLTVLRGGTDKYGNSHKAVSGTVEGVFAWGKYARAGQDGRGESSQLKAELYVKRGTDLRARDRVVRSNGDAFAVVGGPAWDAIHPFDGFDFGWMIFQLESM